MKIFPRILLWLFALGIAAVSVLGLLDYAGLYRVRTLELNDQAAVVAVIAILFSLYFLFARTGQRPAREPETVTHRLENGDVKISYETIEQLVGRAASTIRGVQNQTTRVRTTENGLLKIMIRYSIEVDLDIPKTTADLQEAVKTYIVTTTGIKVDSVTVYVTELAVKPDVVQVTKRRVE
ncbi:alkaline shock response membrane anchor protein AmaP [Tumebacillus permanentifrigoris]|uniref:Putative alkaline shock family protein YloU n=1 Tax=Tumebacillus permanentifrigoris TaxID=378543 RepID=A0A316D7G1_9BACL|nr:alkaline shock response membrane anchor protein AmaP [Tumebacillus permanentifrigoris]PWK11508.1 putative alkaline shock family protein YloU [Tumebacillus permanentifrigoris]